MYLARAGEDFLHLVMPASDITFILPVFNGLDYTRACLNSLRETVDLAKHEVIVVDDLSTDGTREFLAELPPPFRVVLNDTRRNYAANNNAAAAVARGEFLCLLNNDLVFTPGWLEPMLRPFDRFPKVGFVGNVQRNPRTGRYDHMGIIFGDSGLPWHFGKHFTFRPYRGYREWKAVTAACCLIKRTVFLEAGGFDEGYINGSEDIDLCLRLGAKGYRHYVANDSVIYHHVSSSPGRHAFTGANEARLLARWQTEVKRSVTTRDRRLAAANYLLRFAAQPWRYNGRRLCHAALSLALPARFTHATAHTQR
jgi:O-antigen biosynthesis protein